MIDITKVHKGDLVWSGSNYEYLCKVLKIKDDNKLLCHMYSEQGQYWINVNLIIDPSECIEYSKCTKN